MKFEPDPDRESATQKALRSLNQNGETITLTATLKTPYSNNWLLSQQMTHLLDDLAYYAAWASFLVDVKRGWGWKQDDPRQADLDILGEMFTITVSSPATNPKEYAL